MELPCGGNRCCTGFRGAASNHANGGLAYSATNVTSRANVMGGGDPGTSHKNAVNGICSFAAGSTSFSNICTYSYGIGNFLGFNMTGKVAEVFTFN